MFERVPRAARKMIGQPFDGEKLQEIFLRHGIRGWEIRSVDRVAEPAESDVIPISVNQTITRQSEYFNQYSHLRIKARSGYAKVFTLASQIIHPKATPEETVERLQRHAQRTLRRFEWGFEFSVDTLCWSIDRVNLPKQRDQGEKRPYVEVVDGIVQSMQMRFPR